MASKGAFGRASGRLRRSFGTHTALSEGLRKGVLRCGTSRRWFSKGSPRGMLRAGYRRGLPEEFGSEGGFRRRFRRGSSERVLRRGCEWGLPEGFRRASERLSSGAALVVGLRIYGPGGPASSDWPNGQAVPGRPIGDQRRHASGLSLLSGASERGRPSATAAGHAGCVTGQFKSIGAGKNRTRRARRT